MRDNELVAVIKSHRKNALGADDGALSLERADAFDHYHGRPYGNEVEGRSSIVPKDLSETVDWAMPAILRIYTQSGNVAEFEPVGPEDEELAQQESEVINKVFMQDCKGFMVLHDAIKDALLLKNGYIKHFWDERQETETTRYTGLSIEGLTRLFGDLEADGATVEVLEQAESVAVMQGPQGPVEMPVFDVRVKVTRTVGRVCCLAVPPEEIRVARNARGSLSEAAFVEHVTRKTRSDLIEMGLPRDFVDSLPAHDGDENDNETLARDSNDDESERDGVAFADRAMDEIDYCEAYLRVDYDGDGIAELRKVVTCADRVPPGPEWNEEIDAIPISGGAPKRVPHRHVGESLDDEIADLQSIKTTLMRQMLDNIYATNNNQWLVNERVNLADFLTSLPGGIKRVKGMEPIAGAVEAVQSVPILGQIMPAIDYIDATKQARTGINSASTGLDPDVLKQATKGAFLENLNRASQKIEMMARMLGETLIKDTLLSVHALLVKRQDKPMMVRLRGKFVEINPQEWRNRTDIVLKVGIGTGNGEEKRQKLMMLTQMQDRLMPLGMVGPAQAYAIFADMSRAMGFDMPEKYALSPDSPEFQQKANQPPPPNPLLEVEAMKQQGEAQKLMVNAQIEREKAAADIQQEQLRSQNDVAIETSKIDKQMELERWKAQLEAETALQKARIDAELKLQIEQIKAANVQPPASVSVNNDPNGDFAGMMAQYMQSAAAQQEAMLAKLVETLSRPRSIMRGPDGRAIGVQ